MPKLNRMQLFSPPNMNYSRLKAFFTTKTVNESVKEVSKETGISEKDIYLPLQKHTDRVLILEDDLRPEIADAVLTQRKGLFIGVQVADCVPILLFDRGKSVVGAVHAGWRGTASQIIRKAVKAMIERFNSLPEDIGIAIGPSIERKCYEVGKEVRDAIYEVMGEGEYYAPVNGKYCVDLPSANVIQAMSLGIPRENIWISNICTYCNPHDFHSYRYHRDRNGRQVGFIGVF